MFVIAAAFAAASFLCVRVVPRNLLWKSQADIKAAILKEAPLGSSIDQVKALIERKKWRVMSEWHGSPSNISSDNAGYNDYPGVKGEYFIQGDLGGYQGIPFRVGVDAHWGFDSSGRLLDLRIRKGHEGL